MRPKHPLPTPFPMLRPMHVTANIVASAKPTIAASAMELVADPKSSFIIGISPSSRQTVKVRVQCFAATLRGQAGCSLRRHTPSRTRPAWHSASNDVPATCGHHQRVPPTSSRQSPCRHRLASAANHRLPALKTDGTIQPMSMPCQCLTRHLPPAVCPAWLARPSLPKHHGVPTRKLAGDLPGGNRTLHFQRQGDCRSAHHRHAEVVSWPRGVLFHTIGDEVDQREGLCTVPT